MSSLAAWTVWPSRASWWAASRCLPALRYPLGGIPVPIDGRVGFGHAGIVFGPFQGGNGGLEIACGGQGFREGRRRAIANLGLEGRGFRLVIEGGAAKGSGEKPLEAKHAGGHEEEHDKGRDDRQYEADDEGLCVGELDAEVFAEGDWEPEQVIPRERL